MAMESLLLPMMGAAMASTARSNDLVRRFTAVEKKMKKQMSGAWTKRITKSVD